MGSRKARTSDRDPRKGGKFVHSDRHGQSFAFPPECRRKNAYTTKTRARDAAVQARKLSGEPVEPYTCRKGGVRHFHIGHPPGWKAANKGTEKATS